VKSRRISSRSDASATSRGSAVAAATITYGWRPWRTRRKPTAAVC
jgi:hypothetical protein